MSQHDFTSRMSKAQYITAFVYFPLHLVILPVLLVALFMGGFISYTAANVGLYGIGLIYMLITQFSFLRRDFDALCDRFLFVLRTVLTSYCAYWIFNLIIASVFTAVGFDDNPNQSAIVDTMDLSAGAVTAMTVFMAPIVEELLFRGAVFGLIRRKSRVWAYIVSVAAFSLYHVLGYALTEPVFLVYTLQYIPVSWLLARSYEKTDSIWTSILLHMTVNGVSTVILNMI